MIQMIFKVPKNFKTLWCYLTVFRNVNKAIHLVYLFSRQTEDEQEFKSPFSNILWNFRLPIIFKKRQVNIPKRRPDKVDPTKSVSVLMGQYFTVCSSSWVKLKCIQQQQQKINKLPPSCSQCHVVSWPLFAQKTGFWSKANMLSCMSFIHSCLFASTCPFNYTLIQDIISVLYKCREHT